MGPQSISSIFFGKIPFFPACTRVYEVFWSVLIVFKICSGMDIKSSPPRSALKLVLKGTSFTWARMQHTSSVKHLSLLVCPSRDVIRWISGSSLMWRLHAGDCIGRFISQYNLLQRSFSRRAPPFHPVFMAVESPERNGKDPVELCCSRIFRSPWATFSAVQGAQKMMVLHAWSEWGSSVTASCYDPSFLTWDICGYLPLRKNQRIQLIHYLFYMDIFLGSALLQDQTFFDQDTSLDDCSQSGHLRVEKLFPLTDKEWQFGVRRTLRTFFCSDTGYVQQSTKGS